MTSRSSAVRAWRASLLLPIALLTPGALRAQAAADTVHACYVPLSGTIYRIRAAGTPGSCTRPEHKAFALAAPGSRTAVAAAGGGNNAPVDHGTLTGLGDDDHSQYLLAQGARASLNGFAVTATVGQGTIPATGAGARLLWHSRKAALRAGQVSGAQWDDANVGLGSFAAGLNTTASGQGSTALGTESLANGTFAIAAGASAFASGQYAIALGGDARATGFASMALGTSTTASGTRGIAIGSSASVSDEAFAFGRLVSASAFGAMALGNRAQASASSSFAIGNDVSTNGKTGAIVIGDGLANGGTLRASANNQLAVRAQRVWLGTGNALAATSGRFLETSTGAYLSSGGAWVSSSDSTKKHRWADVDGEMMLAKLAALPVRTWSYRAEDDSVRHMGPTAQEFRAAFGLGDAETSIAGVDADGVSLAAAKALEERTRVLRSENVALRRENAELADRLARVEAALASLFAAPQR